MQPPSPTSADFPSDSGWQKKILTKETKGVKVLKIAVGAAFALTRFSLVRISARDLVADRNS